MSEIKTSFSNLGLNTFILRVLKDLGYSKPSPIQTECIPCLLNGHDVLGVAQTGSGKTAAFVLPLLQNINLKLNIPQILILVPTRELAIQIKEFCLHFSKYKKEIKIAALYGGQRYDIQLRAMRQGSQIIIGTPGRLLDHLNNGCLDLSNLYGLILDEADEMLRMGFIEDVENILKKIPVKRQTALFSATMPAKIRKISGRFMNKPKEIYVESNVITSPNIKQTYCIVRNMYKSEALIRFLEVENFDAVIIFVRTKNATLEINKILENNGYNSTPLNGDMNQILREKTLSNFKNGNLDILIATDIAARGLDIDRISLVINYDIPMDAESYIHRIGRTGRAGHSGRALLIIEQSEYRQFYHIKNKIKLDITEVKLPNNELLIACRISKLEKKIKKNLKNDDIDVYRKLLNQLKFDEKEKPDIITLAAALLKIAQGKRSLILPKLNKNFYLSAKLNKNNNYLVNKINKNIYQINIGFNDKIKKNNITEIIISTRRNINKDDIINIKLFKFYSTFEVFQNKYQNNILPDITNTTYLKKSICIKLLKIIKKKFPSKKSFLQKKDYQNNRISSIYKLI